MKLYSNDRSEAIVYLYVSSFMVHGMVGFSSCAGSQSLNPILNTFFTFIH